MPYAATGQPRCGDRHRCVRIMGAGQCGASNGCRANGKMTGQQRALQQRSYSPLCWQSKCGDPLAAPTGAHPV